MNFNNHVANDTPLDRAQLVEQNRTLKRSLNQDSYEVILCRIET